jgi:tellurite resistance protein TerC
METDLWFWVAFNAGVLVILAIDLFGFHREAKPVKTSEAAIWVSVLIGLSLAFNALVFYWKGPDKGWEFLTGYLVEYSLSVDNIFVFVLIFNYFAVPAAYQHRVLFWGVFGALVMRGLMIGVGVSLIHRFEWILYVCGVFLVFTGFKMCFGGEPEVDPEKNPVVRFCRKLFPVTDGYRGAKFMVREAGKLALTPLALVLVMVETTDLIFAVDSIPAIFAITQDPFIIYTSNVCAILGLRALYFLLAGLITTLTYLKYSLGFILAFIGTKMLIKFFHIEIPQVASLVVVALALLAGVVVSLVKRPSEPVQKSE